MDTKEYFLSLRRLDMAIKRRQSEVNELRLIIATPKIANYSGDPH